MTSNVSTKPVLKVSNAASMILNALRTTSAKVSVAFESLMKQLDEWRERLLRGVPEFDEGVGHDAEDLADPVGYGLEDRDRRVGPPSLNQLASLVRTGITALPIVAFHREQDVLDVVRSRP